MKRVIVSGLILFVSQSIFAQTEQSLMEGSGKIYVVLATVLAIYAGILIFLTIIERKLSNLERQIRE